MSRTRRHRLSRVALGAAFLLVAVFDAQTTSPALPEERPAPPSVEEVVVLEELLDWIRGGPASGELTAFRGDELALVVQSRPRSFELFRGYAGRQERHHLLHSLPYGQLIGRVAERYRLDGLLLAAIVEAESGFDPEAISPVGALGLMQVMPDTASGTDVALLHDPAVNLDRGARYLSLLLREFGGDLTLALAAYNAGPGSVARYDGVPPYSETRHYLERVLGRYVDLHQRLWWSGESPAWLLPSGETQPVG